MVGRDPYLKRLTFHLRRAIINKSNETEKAVIQILISSLTKNILTIDSMVFVK